MLEVLARDHWTGCPPPPKSHPLMRAQEEGSVGQVLLHSISVTCAGGWEPPGRGRSGDEDDLRLVGEEAED